MLTDNDVKMMEDLALMNREIEVFLVKTGSDLDNDACTDIFGKKDGIGEDDDFYDSDYRLSKDEVGIDCEDGVFEGAVERKSQSGLDLIYEEEEINVGDESDVCESDELRCLDSDDEDNTVKKKKKTEFTRFNPVTDLPDHKLVTGLLFTNVAEFKSVVRSHAITWQRDIKFVKNDDKRVRAKCREKKCGWVMHASRTRDKSCTFQVKTLNTIHKCGRSLSKNRFVTSKMLSQKYLNDWRLNNGWKLDDFQEKVQNDLDVEVSRSQFYRTKNKVNDLLYGKYKDQYKRIYDYCAELRVNNPGSTVLLKTVIDDDSGEERFLRMYVAFDACNFHGCRTLIGLDGCHLKGPHKGILLTDVSIDPNNCILPICYCVAETENNNTWKWFLEIPCEDLSIYEQNKWTFISDRQKGLLPALHEILPEVEHRYCVRHMHNNFKKYHHGLGLKDRVWNLAKVSTVAQFNWQMDLLKEVDEGAHQWLSEVPAKHWSRSNFSVYSNCDILRSNLCESFNATVLEARNKPLLNMLEKITINIQKRLQAKRIEATKWDGPLCPKIQKILEKLKNDTRSCIFTYVGASKFEEHQSSQTFSVLTLENPSVAAPPSPPPPTLQASSVCIGGVSVKASSKKKGKACVTLKSLKNAAASRLKKGNGEGESNMGMSTQQSSLGMNEDGEEFNLTVTEVVKRLRKAFQAPGL
ncbi:hypothetical protein BUALT_Bualt19G0076300 [Buddleja alternifolia]|uniref:Transposase n=1 Tax=Buddleja alternifolia TaxID=168488 RepID=A0AAV6W0A6_9LAMI|nr:hypothetical protein BUALT_Bualt19G0076300 [Buddleja alternifolia]